MQTALEMTTIVGIKTNIPLHLVILANTDFIRGAYSTQFLERLLQNNGASK
jgi:acetyl-CoA carboxylase biotin carboxylase subunit